MDEVLRRNELLERIERYLHIGDKYSNGEMREVSTVEADDSAYLYVSEKRKCLYAVMESLEYKGVPGGGVAAYHIEDNKLSF